MARRTSRRKQRLATTGAVAAVTVGSMVLGSAPAHADNAGADDPVKVSTGTTVSSLPVTQVFGDTDPNTPETASFVLRMPGMGGLGDKVESGMKHFLSADEFASRYGQSDANIKQLTDYLASFGITTQVLSNHLDVTASGTAGQFDKALTIKQENVQAKGPKGGRSQRVHAPKGEPLLPRHLGKMVTAILGLSNYAPYTSQTAHVDADKLGTAPADAPASTCAVSGVRMSACHLPSDFASRYGLDPLYKQGKTGAGRTVGIVTLAALDEGAPETFWSQYLGLPSTGRSVSVQNIDGGPGAPSGASGSDETDLDVEQAGALAPGSNVVVYQSPNTDAGWVDALFTAASQNTADTVSSSWGSSDTVIKAAIASGSSDANVHVAYDEAFLEMAAQGQSAFLSAGDSGAYTASRDLGTTDLSADSPADSPFVTSAGGTTLPWSGNFHSGSTAIPVGVTQERAWGWDYLWQPLSTLTGKSLLDTAKANIEGGGGGYSSIEPRPLYQRGISGVDTYSAVQYLTPTTYQNVDGLNLPTDWTLNMTPTVTTGHGTGRAEADVSANADPYSGYLLYSPSADGGALQAGWGGTSFVAPQFNGSTAVIDEAVGHRIGLWNPAMYKQAKSRISPVTPLNTQGTSSDNLYYTGTPGTLYNPAVGLGTPNLSVFAAKLK